MILTGLEISTCRPPNVGDSVAAVPVLLPRFSRFVTHPPSVIPTHRNPLALVCETQGVQTLRSSFIASALSVGNCISNIGRQMYIIVNQTMRLF